MTSKLDAAIEQCINFYDCLHDLPLYDDLPYPRQIELLAAYVLDMPHADLGEITLLVDEYIKREDIAALMTYSPTDDHYSKIIGPMSCYRVAVCEYAKGDIDGRIQDLFRDYCQSNGIYSHDGPEDPDELIGFRNDDRYDEARQQEIDDVSLLQNQAE